MSACACNSSVGKWKQEDERSSLVGGPSFWFSGGHCLKEIGRQVIEEGTECPPLDSAYAVQGWTHKLTCMQHAATHTLTHTNSQLCICAHTCTLTTVHMSTHMCIQDHAYVYTHTCTLKTMPMCAYMHTHDHAHAHRIIHTRTLTTMHVCAFTHAYTHNVEHLNTAFFSSPS